LTPHSEFDCAWEIGGRKKIVGFFMVAFRKEQVMTEFTNVTVIKRANVYFDGKVSSRAVLFPDGSRKTLGIMLPGDYEFGTAEKEIMEIIAGDLEVLLPESGEWKKVKDGETFEVPAQSKFGLKIKKVTDYCCSYMK
jgi:hypothetical protein